MITVDLGDLEGERDALAEYFQTKLQASVKINGKMLLVDDSKVPIRTRDVKMYLKQFIYHRKFPEEYRVIVDHPLIRVLKAKTRKKSKPRREEVPAPNPEDTMPWFFPKTYLF